MQHARPGIALHPRHFGRAAARTCALVEPKPLIGDDVKLFAMTFAAGFLFVSVLIA